MGKQANKANTSAALVTVAAPAPSAPAKRTIQKNRVTQNGVTAPSAGGKCAAVWEECTALHSAGVYPTVQHMRAYAARTNTNPNNAQIELYVWRKHNGVASVRISTVARATPAAK